VTRVDTLEPRRPDVCDRLFEAYQALYPATAPVCARSSGATRDLDPAGRGASARDVSSAS
jgi:hypothetical protein